VAHLLRGLRSRLRAQLVLLGAGRWLALAAAALAVMFALDWSLVLPAPVRLVLLALAAAALGAGAWRWLLRPAGAALPDVELAHRLEASHPGLADRLLSAVAFTRAGGVDPLESPMLAARAVADAEAAVRGVRPAAAAPGRRARRTALLGLGAAGLVAAAGAANPELVGIWARRALGADLSWPRRTQLEVLRPAARESVVARGEPLEIRVRATGAVPARATLVLTLREGDSRSEVRLARDGADAFAYDLASVPGDLSFYVEAGDGRTSTYTVHALIPPQLESIQTWLEPPPHTRVPRTATDAPIPDGNVRAPAGTQVRLVAKATKALREARLEMAGGTAQALAPGPDGRTLETRFEVAEDATYVIALLDTDGLRGRTPYRFHIRAVLDRPPALRAVFPSGDRSFTPQAVLPLALEATDDYGVAALRATVASHHAAAGDGNGAIVSLPVAREADGFGPTSARATAALDLATMGVREKPDAAPRPLQAGDTLHLVFEAEDHRPLPSPNVTRSRDFALSIVSSEQLEKAVTERLNRMRDLVRTAQADQDDAARSTEALPREATPAPEADAVARQRQAQRRAGEVADEMTRILEEATVNRLGDPAWRTGLGELGTLANRVAREQAPAATRALDEMRGLRGEGRATAIAAAREAQLGAVTTLADLLARLERWEALADILWAVRRVRDGQESLKDRVLDQLRQRVGGEGAGK
jgi:hypothetical protein